LERAKGFEKDPEAVIRLRRGKRLNCALRADDLEKPSGFEGLPVTRNAGTGNWFRPKSIWIGLSGNG